MVKPKIHLSAKGLETVYAHGKKVRKKREKEAKKARQKAYDKQQAKKKKKGTGGIKKPHRFHPGTVALRQIRKYQKSDRLLAQRAPSARFIRKCMQDADMDRISPSALIAMQNVMENYVVSLMAQANFVAMNAGRKTVMPKDVDCVSRIVV